MHFKDEIETAIHKAENLAAKGDFVGAIYALTDALNVIKQRLPDEQ